ncbi:MAG: hypothetical protein ACK4XK_02480, partial [Casimicrobiaceae bacterium]
MQISLISLLNQAADCTIFTYLLKIVRIFVTARAREAAVDRVPVHTASRSSWHLHRKPQARASLQSISDCMTERALSPMTEPMYPSALARARKMLSSRCGGFRGVLAFT